MAITQKQVKGVAFEDFDPNNFQQANEVWAIYDASRFRTFSSRAPVLSAFINQYRAKLYWMQPDGSWRELAVKDGHYLKDRNCDWCGASNDQNGGWGLANKWVWEKFGGKIPPGPDGVKLLYLCSTCRSING